MERETLEEAAEDFYHEQSKAYEDECEPMFNISNYLVAGFIKGAKWQAERMYSEEEVRELLLTQRGNCYVAILTKTKDIELASLAMSAPEPSGKNGWKKQFKNK